MPEDRWTTGKPAASVVSTVMSDEGLEQFLRPIASRLSRELIRNEMLHLEHSFLWYWNLDSSENGSEVLWNLWIVVLEKDGEVSWSDRMKNEEVEERRRKELPISN